jgi:hypothetical protein
MGRRGRSYVGGILGGGYRGIDGMGREEGATVCWRFSRRGG